jgi:predicted metal-dependent hydrolase
LEVTRDASLIVRVPKRASIKLIKEIVNKNQFWIRKKQDIARKKCQQIAPKEFVDGEGFLYFGDVYKLIITDSRNPALKFDNAFYLSREHLGNARELFIDWYKERAYKIIAERVNWYSSASGLKYNKIKITNAQKRWGSCSIKNNLNFSWRLIMAPLRVIDYLVVHELAHVEEKNHSKRFWNKVKVMLPNYVQQRKWLKDNEHILNIF